MRAGLVSAAVLIVASIPIQSAWQPGASNAAAISGELRQWHKVTLTFNGPQASETDSSPNPFTDYRMTVTFTHESGAPRYEVPGYFAADGDAANTSATSGNKWRVHLSPDKTGRWNWRASFVAGPGVAITAGARPGRRWRRSTAPPARSRSRRRTRPHPTSARSGRLQYVGKHYLRFAGSGEYFLKAGPDSPETLLAYEDFDDTAHAQDGAPHLRAARPGLEDRRSHVGRRQGQGADRRHQLPGVERHERDVVPAVQRRGRRRQRLALRRSRRQVPLRRVQAGSVADRLRSRPGARASTCTSSSRSRRTTTARLAPAAVAVDAAERRRWWRRRRPRRGRAPSRAGACRSGAGEGRGGGGRRPGRRPCAVRSLDCGDTGRERRLYLRELIARFGYELALNWNMGEENTQTTVQQRAMAQYIHDVDPYDHIVVLHTFPNQQEDVYQPHLGQTLLQGLSLQNSWNAAHQQTARWVRGSAAAGVPWVVANDEQGSASTGVPPDPGLPGVHGQGQPGQHGPVAPRHPQADAVGQPDGGRRRRRVLLRLRPAGQRPHPGELPQPRQVVGLRARSRWGSSATRRFRSGR